MIVYPGVEAAGCFGSQFSVELYRGLCVTSTRIGYAERKHFIGALRSARPFLHIENPSLSLNGKGWIF